MKFMCKYSGLVYSFELEHDIKSMLTHPDYVQVDEEEKKEEPAVKRGRPAKKADEEADE
jgi:hypothetical protein